MIFLQWRWVRVDKKKLKLECTLNNKLIESVIPGDFDGDGGMDVFVTVKDDDDDETLADKVLISHQVK